MTAIEKPYRFVLKEYRQYISENPCCCNVRHRQPCDPAHMEAGGMGTKASDLLTVPLCHECHVTIHKSGRSYLELEYHMRPCEIDRIGWRLLVRWVEAQFRSGRFK